MDTETGETLGQWEDSAQCQRLESPRACAHGMESESETKQKTFPLLYGKLRNSVQSQLLPFYWMVSQYLIIWSLPDVSIPNFQLPHFQLFMSLLSSL